MDNNIIRMYYLFDRYAFNYYDRFSKFSINGHEDEHMVTYIDDDGEEYEDYEDCEDTDSISNEEAKMLCICLLEEFK